MSGAWLSCLGYRGWSLLARLGPIHCMRVCLMRNGGRGLAQSAQLHVCLGSLVVKHEGCMATVMGVHIGLAVIADFCLAHAPDRRQFCLKVPKAMILRAVRRGSLSRALTQCSGAVHSFHISNST